MKRLEQILFFLLIFLIPIQLGRHFWPNSAFISGIRVDYLSPTLYLTDILLGALFIIHFYRKCVVEKNFPKWEVILIFAFSTCSLLSTFALESVETFLYLYIRSILYIVFGYVAAGMGVGEMKRLAKWYVAGAMLPIIIEIAQFVHQGSFQGLLYFLGERSFSLSTPSIARFMVDGHLLLRPYATFPHPNVLAWYVFIGLLFVRYLIFKSTNSFQNLYKAMYVFFFCGLLLTFSRVLIFCGILLFLIDLVKKKQMWVLIPIFGVFYLLFPDRFSYGGFLGDFTQRIDHALPLIKDIQENALFGTGLGQYFYREISLQHEISPYFLQPVHNSYILIFLQMGLAGLVVCGIGILASFMRLFPQNSTYEREIQLLLLFTLLFASFFDHFFVTLHQGMILTALVIGIVWMKNVRPRG